jgi:hypothetical protein
MVESRKEILFKRKNYTTLVLAPHPWASPIIKHKKNITINVNILKS